MAGSLRPTGDHLSSFVVLAASAGILFGTIGRVLGLATNLNEALVLGAVFGVGTGGFSYAKWRQVSWDVPITDFSRFTSAATKLMVENGYELKGETDSTAAYDRLGVSSVSLASVASLSPGTLYRTTLVWHDGTATVNGPQEIVLKLRATLADFT